jgi:hypothetical protein
VPPHVARYLALVWCLAYVSICQHMSAYVGICQHTCGRPRATCASTCCARQHTSAYVSRHQQTSADISIRQHASACVSIRQHALAYVSIRQHTSAYVSIRGTEIQRHRHRHTICEKGDFCLNKNLICTHIHASVNSNTF